ncbi:MAG: hypothetical protein LBS42_12000 [Tannerella sp.]|jgi:hypothetical protein|nr:hypothetical protein [Tannerella sp.]
MYSSLSPDTGETFGNMPKPSPDAEETFGNVPKPSPDAGETFGNVPEPSPDAGETFGNGLSEHSGILPPGAIINFVQKCTATARMMSPRSAPRTNFPFTAVEATGS